MNNETEFYLQFGTGTNGPFQTLRVAYKVKELPHHKLGRSYTATGYGNKLPSRYMVRFNSRWYRVYSICYSNVSSEYVIIGGERVTVTTY